jgi:UDP-N-acetyl-D-glucosamine dehydrogenase
VLKAALEQKIKDRKAVIGIIGMGYVGLPLAMEFVGRGFRVSGIEISNGRLKSLREGRSYIGDISDAELKAMNRSRKFKAGGYELVADADCIIICVPTPLSKTKDPDLSYILDAVERMAPRLKKGQLVVLESTTYPGTTDEAIAPRIEEKAGLKAGKDIFLGFSPERVDPANKRFKVSQIPKVVSGIDPASLALTEALYASVFDKVVPVTSTRTAEMVKLLENTFRSINIALINEMAMICDTLGIDVWEVIRAASTKPFGFMPFYPGPGIGGHCINIDSMYLAWKVRLHGYEPRLIELAQTINDGMPQVILERITRILNERSRSVRGSRILALGVAYKKNVRDTRESPSLTIIDELVRRGAKVDYHDPHVPELRAGKGLMRSARISAADLKRYDLIVILTDHEKVDYARVIAAKRPILDARNATQGAIAPHIHRL